MRAIILAAGYGTRLGQLTRRTPKALLPVAGRPVIDWLLDRLRPLTDQIYVVSNLRHRPQFDAWCPDDVELIDDGSTSVVDARGALGSLDIALRLAGSPCSTLVSASDTLYTTSIRGLAEEHRRHGRTCVSVWLNSDPNDRVRRGNAAVTDDGRLLELVEKPVYPRHPYSTAPLYAFSASLADELHTYLDRGGHIDSLGRFIGWLATMSDVRTWTLDEAPLDIGNQESLKETQESAYRLHITRHRVGTPKCGRVLGSERRSYGPCGRGPVPRTLDER